MTPNYPYVAVADGNPCPHCGAGVEWSVVYMPLDVALSTTYDDRDEAEHLVADLNEAFQRGQKYECDLAADTKRIERREDRSDV